MMRTLAILLLFLIPTFSLGQVKIEKDKKKRFYLIDENGKRITEKFHYLYSIDPEDKYFAYQTEKGNNYMLGYGILSDSGEIITEEKFFGLAELGNERFEASIDDEPKVINLKGEVDEEYSDSLFHIDGPKGNRYMIKRKNNLYAFYNNKNEPITDFLYSSIDGGDFGPKVMAYVQLPGEESYFRIDFEGNKVEE